MMSITSALIYNGRGKNSLISQGEAQDTRGVECRVGGRTWPLVVLDSLTSGGRWWARGAGVLSGGVGFCLGRW